MNSTISNLKSEVESKESELSGQKSKVTSLNDHIETYREIIMDLELKMKKNGSADVEESLQKQAKEAEIMQEKNRAY
jgi:chromosome segregation ATPase